MNSTSDNKDSFKFLTFVDYKQDAEQLAKLKDAARKIEQAIAREKFVSELVDYVPAQDQAEQQLDPSSLSLYERLEEVKKVKRDAIEESQKLTNYVASLDDEDVSYLNEVERVEREKKLSKRIELNDAIENIKKSSAPNSAEVAELKLKKELTESKLEDYHKKKSSIKERLATLLKVKPTKTKGSHPSDKETKNVNEAISQASKSSDQHHMKTRSSTATAQDSSDMAPSTNEGQLSKRKRESTSEDEDNNKKRGKKEDDECTPEVSKKPIQSQVMRCLGILPSCPIAFKGLSDDSDSDTSKDELDGEYPLLPPCLAVEHGSKSTTKKSENH